MHDDGWILVVDDELDIRETLADVLQDQGYVVKTAANGREALQLMQHEAPCMVLLDLMMPVMDGYEFIEKKASLPTLCGVPVVVISAGRARPDKIGGSEFIAKPIDMQRLFTAIATWC